MKFKAAFLRFLVLAFPVATAFALIVASPTPNDAPPTPRAQPNPINPIADQIQWSGYLREHPHLQPYRDTLLTVSQRLPIESFVALSPQLQTRLARFARTRLNPSSPPTSICWAPGVPSSVIAAFHAVEEMTDDANIEVSAATQFNDTDRWGRNATFTSRFESPQQGLPTTLTWSFVPDGTSIFGFNGEPTSNSDLIAFLDTRYNITNGGTDLTNRPWFTVFQAAFDNIASLTGVSYVYEPNDDGAAFSQTSLPAGQRNRRGDIRIGGHFIDGQSGSNTLAYNFNAGIGDMVIDTGNPTFYANLTSDSLNLRNVVEHEHGHGLGLRHVCPINQTKLMEPFISRQFRGLQLDEIFSLNRLYGDFYEKQNTNRNNDTSANASLLAVSPGTPFLRQHLSIDDNGDIDFYRIDNLPVGSFLNCRIIPVGTPSNFVEGPQNTNGSCSTGTPFDFTSVHNLSLDLIASNGTTVLASANSQPSGQAEEIATFEAQNGGSFFLRVSGDNTDSTQLYTLEIEILQLSPFQAWAVEQMIPESLSAPTADADGDGIPNLQEYYFGLLPLIPNPTNPVSSAISPDGNSYLFSFPRDPNATIEDVFFETSEDLNSWLPFVPDPAQITISPRGALQEVSITLPISGTQRFLRLGLTDPN